jgi:hypothetical protein
MPASYADRRPAPQRALTDIHPAQNRKASVLLAALEGRQIQSKSRLCTWPFLWLSGVFNIKQPLDHYIIYGLA